jgi:hypothetical protein
MPTEHSHLEIAAAKDEESQQKVPTAWRPVLKEVVSRFVLGDYGLSTGIEGVEKVSPSTAAHIQDYIGRYGATLTKLPEKCWESSVCMWYGTHWEVLVDLWTEEEGPSDLVLSARITETPSGASFRLQMVYVP